MTTYVVMLLLAAGFFYNHPILRSEIPSQEAATKVDAKQDPAKEQPAKDTVPKWLSKLIHQLEVAPSANPPDRIIRYEYRNGFVYFLEAGCCDQFSRLYDANGKLMCSTGGITGGGDGNCPDFFTERKDEKVIWEAERKRS
jgi:hypothetical protein